MSDAVPDVGSEEPDLPRAGSAAGSEEPERPWTGSMAGTAARLWRELPDDAAPDPAGDADPPELRRHLRPAGGGRWLLRDRLRELRLDPGRRPATLAVVVAVIAVLITAAVVWHSRPAPQAVAAGAPAQTPSVAVSGTVPGSTPTVAASDLVVAVAGKVRRPGLVHLRPGARVADAIDAAGGLRPGADIGLLNLARVLTDGEQVLVGIDGADAGGAPAGSSGAAGGSAASGAPISLNAATLEQLDTLPGVWEVTAQKIIDYRTQHGPFRSIESLQDIPGIGPARYAEIAPEVTL